MTNTPGEKMDASRGSYFDLSLIHFLCISSVGSEVHPSLHALSEYYEVVTIISHIRACFSSATKFLNFLVVAYINKALKVSRELTWM